MEAISKNIRTFFPNVMPYKVYLNTIVLNYIHTYIRVFIFCAVNL